MAISHKITATSRSDAGKGASRRLRRAGQVPAIIYGGKSEPANIQFEHETLLLAARNEWFYSSVLDLDIDGKVETVLVRDWQIHPYKQQILHMDFLRVDANAEINVDVPLHFLNQDESPAGKDSSLTVMHNLTEVEVVCKSKDLPEHIDVDLANLAAGDVIHMSDLKLPEGVELAALRLGEEHDQAVVSTQAVREEPEEAPAEGDAAAEGGEAAGEDKPEKEG